MLSACGAADPDDGRLTPYRLVVPDGLDAPPEPDTPLTEELVTLGERLFFDPVLSRDGSVSCGSCHRPELAFADGRAVSVGVDGRTGARSAPSLLNVAYHPLLFHDGGAFSLEGQAVAPLENPVEMDLPVGEALDRLRADPSYAADFDAAFPGGEGVSVRTFTRALGAFQRTLLSADARFDRFHTGDPTALSVQEQRGLSLFEGPARCGTCHTGPLLTDFGFHDVGLAGDDPGRAVITGDPADVGRFKTPSLRNVAVTAPYGHDGRFPTLDAVVRHYVRGGDGTPNQHPNVRPLPLSDAEGDALVAFLGTLTDTTRFATPSRP